MDDRQRSYMFLVPPIHVFTTLLVAMLHTEKRKDTTYIVKHHILLSQALRFILLR